MRSASVGPSAAEIRRLLPQKGAMCLIEGVREWSDASIEAWSRSHLDPRNPLRRAGRLPALMGCEYAFQAAALHGALCGGGSGRGAGMARVLACSVDAIAAPFLDEPGRPRLVIRACCEAAGAAGSIYRFRLAADGGELLLKGRCTVAMAGGRDWGWAIRDEGDDAGR